MAAQLQTIKPQGYFTATGTPCKGTKQRGGLCRSGRNTTLNCQTCLMAFCIGCVGPRALYKNANYCDDCNFTHGNSTNPPKLALHDDLTVIVCQKWHSGAKSCLYCPVLLSKGNRHHCRGCHASCCGQCSPYRSQLKDRYCLRCVLVYRRCRPNTTPSFSPHRTPEGTQSDLDFRDDRNEYKIERFRKVKPKLRHQTCQAVGCQSEFGLFSRANRCVLCNDQFCSQHVKELNRSPYCEPCFSLANRATRSLPFYTKNPIEIHLLRSDLANLKCLFCEMSTPKGYRHHCRGCRAPACDDCAPKRPSRSARFCSACMFALVTAENPQAQTSERISLEGEHSDDNELHPGSSADLRAAIAKSTSLSTSSSAVAPANLENSDNNLILEVVGQSEASDDRNS